MQQLRLASLVLALSALLGTTAYAQTSRGTVTGAVTDATKAAVPGATVDIISKDTNITRSTTTNEQGLYRFDAVDPGTYDVTVKAQGFKTYTSRAIPVSAAQVLSIDAALEVGDNVSVVEVTADAVALQTEAPVRGGTINNAAAVNLPVFNRNPVSLAITLPGVTEQRADFPGIGTFSVNGSRGRSNNFLMDGTENNDISVTGQAFQIKIPDAVQEVSVQTANYDAEFGRAGGAVVNTITKSGTNEFHGSLGWVPDFTNDDAITSTLSGDPDITRRGRLAPGYQQYWFGTVGGPIVKNRTFFFTSWQEERRSATNTTVFNTPTVRGQQQIRAAAAQTPNVNPLLNRYLEITSQVPGTNNVFTQDMGNGRGPAEFGQGVYAFPYKFQGRQSLTKGDHRFSDKDMMSLRYGYDRSITPVATANFPGFQTSTQNNYHNVLLTETHIFSPTLTNELRLPFNRIAYDAPNNATSQYADMPQISINALTSVGVSSSYPQGRIANNYGFQDTISWVRGKHTIRTGLDLLVQRSRQFAPASYRGTYSYLGSSAQGQTYTQFANFLDDFAGNGGPSRDFGNPAYYPELFRQQYFISDRWQLRPNLTVTLGLRYEDFGDPVNSLRTPAFTGLFNVTVDRATRTVSGPFNQPNQTKRDRNNFSPSIGITYSPIATDGLLGKIFGDRKTVFRTGFNMGYDSFFNNIASNASTSAPNFVSTNELSTPGQNGQGLRGLANLSTRIPTTPRAIRPDDAQSLVAGNLVNPYYMKWSAGLQRELPWRMVLDASYVGTSGVRLYANEDLNPQLADPSRRVLPSGFSSLAELQAAVPYNLQPRLDPLQGSRGIRTNGSHSSYHSGQFQLAKRFSQSMGFNLAYTFSKTLDNASDIFLINNSSAAFSVPSLFGGMSLDKGLSLYDRPHRLVFSYTYDIPVFKAQKGLVGRTLGGWSMSGIYTYESGIPFNVANGADADGVGGSVERPDINPRGRAGVRAIPSASSPTGYINPDVYVPETNSYRSEPIDPSTARYIGLSACTSNFANCRPGTAPRNSERTLPVNNFLLNARKNIRLTERYTLTFGSEFYNLFNHPQYGYPSVSIYTPGGGTPASTVNTSLAGRFANVRILDGGGRVIRYNLTFRF